MNIRGGVQSRIAVGLSAIAALIVALLPSTSTRRARAATSGIYHQTNLVSDQPGVALITDPNLVNSWGISMSGGSPFWIANNGSGTSTLYQGDVNGSPFTKNPLVVTIPSGLPTGTVFNTDSTPTDFVVSNGVQSGRAVFLFASQVGVVTGWSPAVPPATMAREGGHNDAVYTGLAIGQVGTATFLYAADFEHRKIDVYDRLFHVTTLEIIAAREPLQVTGNSRTLDELDSPIRRPDLIRRRKLIVRRKPKNMVREFSFG